ncbi:hypothetical protein ACFQZI_03425 [Mucilaginibacter lutimaris]|uniref:Uncharacterized protein n=1 Tax=Mucilaginibacter lutimaris TaxID=931629 RepID=A0ABW2ZCQ2_9SPHI
MHTLIFAIIPLLLLFTAPVIQVVLSSKKVHGKIALSFIGINIISLLLGIILPLVATYIFICGISSNIKCITGVEGVAIIGFLITFIATPIIAIISYSNYKSNQKMKEG